ncbi:GNAT family N-acetyltransferase [Micromonospora siamensis]|uniref:Protein N-acetyltransferase, RimJ/RimL family n=1 Tax=Micromonospora siamensis TaxID=299152 RepID=A0A1C5HNV4_9ACTN|nr:GNAT family N-acetyltransferase [Micromonospora siamensis]SCG47597.1 Protein N-acetyltransferase, RimJ/RimL family [Micromonospora siamensis]
MTVFTTERLLVRNWTDSPADLGRLHEIYSRPEVARFLTVPWLPLTGPDRAAGLLARWRARHADHGDRYGTWAIERRDGGGVVGTLLLKPLPGRDEDALTGDIEVGWHLHPECWGHGYATEAARPALERELALGTPEVFAVVSPENAASMAVARRLGMTHLGRRTDWYGGEELETFVRTAPA